MNAGTDYRRARRHAQANANSDGQPRQLFFYNNVWWIDRIGEEDVLVPGAERIEPKQDTRGAKQ